MMMVSAKKAFGALAGVDFLDQERGPSPRFLFRGAPALNFVLPYFRSHDRGTPVARLMSPGFKNPTTEMPTPPSDHIPLGGVVRYEGPP
jgi:hypothetical protein